MIDHLLYWSASRHAKGRGSPLPQVCVAKDYATPGSRLPIRTVFTIPAERNLPLVSCLSKTDAEARESTVEREEAAIGKVGATLSSTTSRAHSPSERLQ